MLSSRKGYALTVGKRMSSAITVYLMQRGDAMTDQEIKEKLAKCQMTVGNWSLVSGCNGYSKCGRPAKYRVPYVAMHVEYVCGIHARSLDKMYERTGQNIRCIPLSCNTEIF